ncbi:MAG: DUF438 domain-containing protein [Chloroflexi bacterium]|nr:DUF438 domain-containing protein [Chloroflexota bacterium]
MDAVRERRKVVLRDIIKQLHQGLSAEQAKDRFEKEVGNVSSTEIAEVEQSLINEGLSPEEIKKFCNVHALIFKSALEKGGSPDTFPSHPVYLFKLENREIEKIIEAARAIVQGVNDPRSGGFAALKQNLSELLKKLKGIETHYERKEQLLFPHLERKGFMGPSKVMWGKDNEVRGLLRTATAGLDKVQNLDGLTAYFDTALKPMLDEVEGMIFKEDNILFPTAIEKLDPEQWVNILTESDDVGYVYISKPHEAETLVEEFKSALKEEPVYSDGAVQLPTGTLQLKELQAMLDTLPIDITFVDKDDSVRYFSGGKGRIFGRTRAIIGRKVQNCHPPQSLDRVEKILNSFKEGRSDPFDFWINFKGKFIYIRYFPVRDGSGKYLGALEMTQDIGPVRGLEGERRLVDETA